MQAGKRDVAGERRGLASSVVAQKRPEDSLSVQESGGEQLDDDAFEADGGKTELSETSRTKGPAGDPPSFCARIWSLCTGRVFDPKQTPTSPEFLEFLERKGLDTPPITPLFDVDYYAEQVSWQIEPKNYVLHYCESALDAALKPHVLFDNTYVLSQSDMAEFDRPPLLYFLERNDPSLSPHPLFEPDLYAKAVGEDFLGSDLPIIAFLERWAQKPASFSSYFCHRYYCLHEPMVRYGSLNPLIHFLSMPPERRRDPNPMFHRGWYAENFASHEIEGIEPLVHYIRHGLPLGLMPNPFAHEELRASSLGLAALVESLRRYLSFPDELSAG